MNARAPHSIEDAGRPMRLARPPKTAMENGTQPMLARVSMDMAAPIFALGADRWRRSPWARLLSPDITPTTAPRE